MGVALDEGLRQPELGNPASKLKITTPPPRRRQPGEDEDWLHELSIDMFPEDGRLSVQGWVSRRHGMGTKRSSVRSNVLPAT